MSLKVPWDISGPQVIRLLVYIRKRTILCYITVFINTQYCKCSQVNYFFTLASGLSSNCCLKNVSKASQLFSVKFPPSDHNKQKAKVWQTIVFNFNCSWKEKTRLLKKILLCIPFLFSNISKKNLRGLKCELAPNNRMHEEWMKPLLNTRGIELKNGHNIQAYAQMMPKLPFSGLHFGYQYALVKECFECCSKQQLTPFLSLLSQIAAL